MVEFLLYGFELRRERHSILRSLVLWSGFQALTFSLGQPGHLRRTFDLQKAVQGIGGGTQKLNKALGVFFSPSSLLQCLFRSRPLGGRPMGENKVQLYVRDLWEPTGAIFPVMMSDGFMNI